MNIIKTSREMDRKDIYKMTKGAGVRKLKELKGATVCVNDWILFTDQNNNGEEVKLLSIKTDEGIYATNSKPFIEEFLKLAEVLDYDMHDVAINILTRTSKAGREFMTLALTD